MFPEQVLKVYYPHGGEHFILRWHSHNEGNHLLIARSQSVIEQLFQSMLEEYPDTKAKEYLKVNIVAPTDDIRQAYAKQRLEYEIKIFWGGYTWMARDYQEKHGSLPAKLKECQSYSPGPDGREEKDDTAHYDCLNCFEGFNPVDGTVESIYLANRDTYLVKHPIWKDKKLVECKAPPADPNKTIYTVNPDFGHHQEGIVLGEGHRIAIDGYFFFYQDPTEVDRSIIEKVLSGCKEKKMRLDNAYEKKRREEQKKREQEQFDELLEIFG